MTTRRRHLRKIRQALKIAFDDVEFSAFCFDYFPMVYDRFSRGMHRDEKRTLLLDHCRRVEGGFETLLGIVWKEYEDNHALKPLLEALEIYLKPAQVIEKAVGVEQDDEESKPIQGFIYRGPLAPGNSLFRGRQAELAKLTELCRGRVRGYAIVYGGRQMGKTSLLLHLPHQLPPSLRLCRIDFQGIPGASTDNVYAYMAEQIARSLAVAPKEVSNSTTLIDFLCHAVKELGGQKLVLCLEELGALGQGTQKDLANILRYIFTNRSTLRPLNRLMIIIAGSLELYDLATIEVSPLHNICEALYLSDLSEAEAVGLVTDGLASLNLSHAKAEALAQAIYAQVSGYPYLTQRLGGALATNAAKGESLTVAHVKRAAQALLRHDTLLRHLRRALQEDDLLAACEELLTGEVRFRRLDEEMSKLELLGLAREVNGHWQVRNRVFGSAIQTWLAAEKRKASAKEKQPTATPSFYGTGKRWAVLVGVNEYEDKAHYAPLPKMVRVIKRRDPLRPNFWFLSYRHPHPPLVPLQAYLDWYRDIEIDTPPVGSWAVNSEQLPYCLASGFSADDHLTDIQSRQARTAFYALCTHIDHQIRILIGTLREEGLLDNTIICFTSDHGDMLGHHRLWAKRLFYERSTNVPMIFMGRRNDPRIGVNVVSDKLVGWQDVMPTLLDLAGVDIPESVEGMSMFDEAEREWLYGEVSEDATATRMIRDRHYKLIYYPVGNHRQLFDLRTDPDEMTDLATDPAHAETLTRLTELLVSELYGSDLQWIQDGQLIGRPNQPYKPQPNRTLSSVRGVHWPPPPKNNIRQFEWVY